MAPPPRSSSPPARACPTWRSRCPRSPRRPRAPERRCWSSTTPAPRRGAGAGRALRRPLRAPSRARSGLNVARNTGVERSTGSSWCSSTTTSAPAPAGSRRCSTPPRAEPAVDVFTGPDQAAPRGSARRAAAGASGRRSRRSSWAPQDTDTRYAWGANMAIRRSALERVGPFDVSLEHGGDEQEWQERLRAHDARRARPVRGRRGGRAPPRGRRRAPALARARRLRARARGAALRRPPRAWRRRSQRELSTLAGCLGHVVRRRCPAGLTMVAHSAGRLREALRERALAQRRGARAAVAAAQRRRREPRSAGDDFLSGTSGTVGGLDALRREASDEAVNAWELASGRRLRLALAARHAPPLRRVLVLGVERPERRALAEAIARGAAALAPRRRAAHLPGRAGAGSSRTSTVLLAAHPADGHDWLLVDRRRRRAAARLPRPLPVPVRALLAGARPAGPPPELPRRLAGHAPARRQRRARDALRGDRPGDGVRAQHVPGAAAVPRSCAWAGAWTSTGRRSRASTAGAAASSTPSRSATAPRPPPPRYAREAAVAEARAFLAGASRTSARTRPRAPLTTHRGW